ncbi:MAG: DUF2161 family putative PD-(D/E)XK-type phosphodiesterase [Clostridiales bacterium]|jgi:hypothetical protein|nr:DUF2161 family putative PD-(D/E)XK-type phosphodiesterase [Clostridiales bacterium]
MKTAWHETDLYLPVKQFFEALGYQVRAEVRHCDVALYKDDRLTVIELKKNFTLQLLYQAIERQKVCDEVYVAIPRPAKMGRKAYKHMCAIVKKLDLGLITVALDSPVKTVEILAGPSHGAEKKKTPGAQKKKRALIEELSARTCDLNTGGSTKRKLMTAYREKAIKVACALAQTGDAKASELVKRFGCDKNTHSIVYKNPYGWFVRTGDGYYALSAEGRAALTDAAFAQVVHYYTEQIKTISAAET